MTNLRKAAEGKGCIVRLPLQTNHDPATVVLAHVKAGWFGMSIKPPDVLGVRACFDCHNEIDRRTRKLPREVVELETLRALYRQILEYCENEVLHW